MASKLFLNTGQFPDTYDRVVKKISESRFYGNYNYKEYDLHDAVNQEVLLFKVFNPDETRGRGATWCFEPETTQADFVGTKFVSNNNPDNYETEAITRLTAQQDFNYLSFDYSYYGDSYTTSEDTFTIKIQKDETATPLEKTFKLEQNKLNSGTYTIGNRTDPILVKGEGFIEFSYKKSDHNASTPDTSDKCSFSNIYGEWFEEDLNSSIKNIKNMYIGVNDQSINKTVNKAVKRAYVGVKNADGTTTTPKLFFTQLPLRVSSSTNINANNEPEIAPLSTECYDLCATTSSHTDAKGNLVHQAWFGGGMLVPGSNLASVQKYDGDLSLVSGLTFECDTGGGYYTAVATGKYVLFLGGAKNHIVHPFEVNSGTKSSHYTEIKVTTDNPIVRTRGGAAVLGNRVFFGGGNLGKDIYQLDCSGDGDLTYKKLTDSQPLVGGTVAAAIADEYAIFCTTGVTSNSTLVSISYEGTVIESKMNGNNKVYADLISFDGEDSALFIGSDKDTLKSDGFIVNYNLTELQTISTSSTPRAYGAGTRLGNHILIAGGVNGEETETTESDTKTITTETEILSQSIDVYNGENFVLEASETNSILSVPRAHLAATTLTTAEYGDCAIFAGGYESKVATITKTSSQQTATSKVVASAVVDVFTVKVIDQYK
jgi:hypothetical protein